MSQLLGGRINTRKIPRSAFFQGEKGTYLDFFIAEKREPSYGETHSLYLYDKATGTKTYIGGAKPIELNRNADPGNLPPGTGMDVEDAQVVDDDTPF